MGLQVLKTTCSLLFMLFIITFLTFFLSWISPSDPAEILLSKTGAPPSNEVLEKTRKEMGIDKPIHEQYINWAKGALQGDLGQSYRTGRSVNFELINALPKTVNLSVLTIFFIIIISIPIAIICTMNQDGLFDKSVQIYTYFFVSVPGFVVAICFLYIFAVKLNVINVFATEGLKGYLMPSLVLALNMGSFYIRQIRAIFLEEYGKDYVIGLRSKGISEYALMFKHVILNSLIPIITLIGTSFAELLAGTAVIENIFSIQGLGYLAVKSVSNRDYHMVQGIVLWMSIIFIVMNIIIEISYGIVDPRIRLSKKGLKNE